MRLCFSCLTLALVVSVAGCGGSKTAAPAAGQDEISKYLAEHPEAKEANTKGINP